MFRHIRYNDTESRSLHLQTIILCAYSNNDEKKEKSNLLYDIGT